MMNQELDKHILVVDDNLELLEFIADDLEEMYDVTIVENGLEAIDVLESQQIDLIISDLMMPQMDGYQLCDFIKNNIKFAHIPLIMLTAKNTIDSKIKGLQIGADAFIEKPFSIAFMRVQIDSLLKNRMKYKEYLQNSQQNNLTSLAKGTLDKNFLAQIENIILSHLDTQNFSIDTLAEMLCMSRPSLYRKVGNITNLSPNDLINKIKLNKAVELLSKGNFKLYEISDKLGYSSSTHFSRNFTKHFGVNPKDYLHKD